MTKVNAAVTRDGAGETRPTTVSLPNMFRTFLEPPPVLNPSYESVRAESEQWLNECEKPTRPSPGEHAR